MSWLYISQTTIGTGMLIYMNKIPPAPSPPAPSPPYTSLKKVIHFLTHKERPDFDGPKSKIAQNCPKIIFAFDRNFQNSKTKLKNDPLKSKNTF